MTGTFEAPSSSPVVPSTSSSSTSPTPPPSVPQAETPVQPNRESGRGRKRRAQHGGELTDYQRELLQVVNKPLDEDEHFFMSLIPAMKRLPPRKRADIRLKFMQVLTEAEFGTDD